MEAIRIHSERLCGGIALLGDRLTVPYTALLEHLDTNEFEVPLDQVVWGADRPEQVLVGTDRH